MPPVSGRISSQKGSKVTCLVIGIDPGASGGMAILYPGGVTRVWRMPCDEDGVLALVRAVCTPDALIAMELVGGYVDRGDGNGGNTGSSMFNFGMGYGGLRMAVLAVCGTLPIKLHPRTWQAGLGISPRQYVKTGRKKVWVETRGMFKNRLKAFATKLFPSVKVTLAVCDALLIAEYMRRKERDHVQDTEAAHLPADGM